MSPWLLAAFLLLALCMATALHESGKGDGL
jgi:hypothetical protein